MEIYTVFGNVIIENGIDNFFLFVMIEFVE